ncbi:RHS repeat domain-containing protein [Rodentibacter caecimuris]|uniref:RHS repeat domain-containing protein n=1 Tax=Rodentibacter caecimuris TaxID=1796644 RepID=UPI001F2DFF1A|nr:RHS repeat-associated core domain-containing protein [Rodentibacter heylii]
MAQCLARTDGQGNRIEHEINYFHCDQIGVPREMTDSEGKLIWRGRYDAWGGLHYDRHLTQQNQGHQPFRLQNQYFDEETGLHYNFLRYYDPITGRFTTQDPIGLAGGENFYRFEGTVQNQIDPLGLFAPALAPAVPWILEGLAYVGTAVAGILIAAGIMDAKEEHDKAQPTTQAKSESISKVGQCNDPCSQYPSKDSSRKIALQTAGIPITSMPIAQNRVPGWEQYMYQSTKVNGQPLIVSHHPADLIHPCPHWHVGSAKMDSYNNVQRRNNGNGTFSWKYYKDYPTIEHRN